MAATAQQLRGVYDVDPLHASFGFAVRYAGVTTFKGTFDDVEATLAVGDDGAGLEGRARVASISIRTPDEFRQRVLGEDFFAADRFPTITFRSERVELADDGSATVVGELTIRGATRAVIATGTWSPESELFGQRKAALALRTSIDRTDFGLTWNADLPTGGKALANEVELVIDLALQRRDAQEG